MSNTATLVGAFSTYSSDISTDAQKSFDQATSRILGVSYSAVAVSQQIVAGTNYNFFCNAKASIEQPFNYAAIVSVFQPLDGGEAHVTRIQRV